MDNPNPIINIGDLAKPANTLIEKISDAIGGLYRPTQIKRVAEAEAEAEKIRAVAQIEITDLQRRAMARFFLEEAKKQNNIEAITQKALPDVTEDARPDKVDNDWIAHFFDKSRLISDDDMQNLWAKVLSGQANSPGTYSKKTIDILADLEKSDAILFSTLCSFAIILDKEIFPLIYDTSHKIYINQGITFASISHLESLGLLHFNHLSGYLLHGLDQGGFVLYLSSQMWIEFPKPENNDFEVGKILLTQAGQQLARICQVTPIEGFADYLKEKWKNLGYKTEPDANQSSASEGKSID